VNKSIAAKAQQSISPEVAVADHGPIERVRADTALRAASVRLAGDLRRIPLEEIEVPRHRIRRDLGAVGELAESLHTTGLLNPITVYERNGRFTLIAGERRLEAARRLGAAEIDAMVRVMGPEDDPLVIELLENLQRRELDAEEEADAFISLVRDRGYAMQDVAAAAGRSVAYISKRVRVFEDPVLRRAIAEGLILPSIAEELLVIAAEQRVAVLDQALHESWDGEAVRRAVRALQRPSSDDTGATGPALPPPLAESSLEENEEEKPAEAFRSESSGGNVRVVVERPSDLTRRLRDLNALLSDLRPFQFTPEDDRAMEALFNTLRLIAQAPRERRNVLLPPLEAATRGRR
jgi:ParB family chromosome partitioning protein